MNLRYLLDTSVVSAPILRQPDRGIIARLERESGTCAIAAPVWQELLYGCRLLPEGRRRAALEAYLETVLLPSFPILPYEETAAAWHAEQRARLESEGMRKPFVDGQIAAIAAVNDLIVVTRNVKDFARFGEPAVEAW